MKRITLIAILFALQSKAQIQKISKRALRLKTIKCDTFLTVTEEKNNTNDTLVNTLISQLVVCDEKNESYKRELVKKDSTIYKLNKNYDKTISEIKPEKPFYLKPYVYISAFIGYLIAKL
jgi:hypothetical protein